MSKKSTANSIDFEGVLQAAVKLPGVWIDRTCFLRGELSKHFESKTVDKAVALNPAQAGISTSDLEKIAQSSIAMEAAKVTAISAAAGIPGGLAMIGTIPADLIQYFGHILRILQKLVYLYGWQGILTKNSEENELDDGASDRLTLFAGVMFGIESANAAVSKIAAAEAANVPKALMNKELTKGALYPTVKKVAALIGVKMSKQLLSKGVGKIIPIVGAFVSGGLTIAGFLPMAFRLKDCLGGLPLADVEFYKKDHSADKVDLDFREINAEESDSENL